MVLLKRSNNRQELNKGALPVSSRSNNSHSFIQLLLTPAPSPAKDKENKHEHQLQLQPVPQPGQKLKSTPAPQPQFRYTNDFVDPQQLAKSMNTGVFAQQQPGQQPQTQVTPENASLPVLR